MYLKACGFTMIEMLITVVMVSILAAIALPSYQESIRSTRRGEAKVELMLLAKAQMKWRATDIDYADTDELDGITALKSIKSVDGNTYYDYAVVATTNAATTFKINATPKGTQTNDSCGTLSVDETITFVCSSGIKP